MRAEAKSLRFLGESPQKLTVPFFQRRYVWKEENWEELINSLNDTDSKPFLGSIILKLILNPMGPSEANVIDGQQRITTLTILSKAIYDSLPDDKKLNSGIRRDVESFLFYTQNASDDFDKSKVKIVHSRTDVNDYNYIIQAGLLNDLSIDLNTISVSSGQILKCYKFFMEKIKDKNIDELKALHNNMFNENRKMLILIVLEQGDENEQTIFDTINRAGVRLSTADIIKNNLFKKCLDLCSSDIERDLIINKYDTCWVDVFYNEDKEDNYIWDETRVFGNVRRTNLEFLLYCIATILWGKQKELFSDLAKVYNEQTTNMSLLDLQHLIDDIKSYAIIYKNNILDLQIGLKSDDSILFKYKDDVKRLMLIFEVFGVQMFYPFVLKRLYDHKNRPQITELTNEFKVLESFVIRRRLSKIGVTDYALKCNIILENGINELKNDIKEATSGITDKDIETYIKSIKPETAKIILFCIELYRRKSEMSDVSSLEYKYTLEHILPIKWETHWITTPIKDIDGNNIKDLDGNDIRVDTPLGQEIRNKAIVSIGNMTLLTNNLNSSIKNNTFEKKVKGDGLRKPGYKEFTTLSLTSKIVDQFNSGDIVWDEGHIEKREKKLLCEIIELWPSCF